MSVVLPSAHRAAEGDHGAVAQRVEHGARRLPEVGEGMDVQGPHGGVIFFGSSTMYGTIISSIEMPPCWNVLR